MPISYNKTELDENFTKRSQKKSMKLLGGNIQEEEERKEHREERKIMSNRKSRKKVLKYFGRSQLQKKGRKIGVSMVSFF